MIHTELYSLNNNCVIESCRYIIDKYKHLLHWKKKPSILELATGCGRTTEKVLIPILPEDFDRLVGSDNSHDMIDYASKNVNLYKMTFQHLDVTDERLPEDFEAGFDHVISFFLFHWVKETDQAFRNIFQLLSPGGELFAICFSEVPIDEPFEKLSQDPKWKKYRSDKWISPYYKNPFVVDIYRRHLEQCGFVDIIVNAENYVYEYESEEEWKGIQIAVNPTISEVAPEELDEYLNDYFKYFKSGNCITVVTDENGKETLRSNHKLLVIYAKKPKQDSD